MEIRAFIPSDVSAIVVLFHNSVHAIDSGIYSHKQKEAWAPSPPDYSAWETRLAAKQPYVAVKQGIIVGFIELEKDGHIDCLYVHKEYQRMGVGSLLLNYLIQEASRRKLELLYVEASKVAKPFFEKFGFSCQGMNKIMLRNQVLINYNMSLRLKL